VDQLLLKNPEDRPTAHVVSHRLSEMLAGRASGSSHQLTVAPADPVLNLSEFAISDSFVLPESSDVASGYGIEDFIVDLSKQNTEFSEEDWSDPMAEIAGKSTLVASSSIPVRKSSKRSPELEFGLRMSLILTVIFSLFIFVLSLRAFLNQFMA
jgi:hypothetical protein